MTGWTRVEDEIVTELLRLGCNYSEIGRMLGRTRFSVRNRIRRLGDPTIPNGRADRWSADEDAELIQLVGEGMPDAEVAERLGRTAKAVRHRRGVHGLISPRRRARWSDDDVSRALAMQAEGRGSAEIAKRLGRTPEAVQRYFMRRARGGPSDLEQVA